MVCTGGPLPGANVVVTFAGQLAPGPQPVITGTATGLTGSGSPAVAVAHTTTGQGVRQQRAAGGPGRRGDPEHRLGPGQALADRRHLRRRADRRHRIHGAALREQRPGVPGRDRPGHDRARRLLDPERHRSCAGAAVGRAARRRWPAGVQPADAARRGAGQRLRGLRRHRADDRRDARVVDQQHRQADRCGRVDLLHGLVRYLRARQIDQPGP